jgi:hypothetical protein
MDKPNSKHSGSISRTAKASMNNSMSFHFTVTALIIQSSRHKEHYGNLQNWEDRTKVNQMQKDRQSLTVRNRQATTCSKAHSRVGSYNPIKVASVQDVKYSDAMSKRDSMYKCHCITVGMNQ